MDSKIPSRILSLAFVSVLTTACCQQPQSTPKISNTGNCHTHNENAAKGATKHCHAHVNGSNHTHTYGGTRATVPVPSADLPSSVRREADVLPYPSHYDRKRKGYYRGPIDEVIDPYAKDVLSSYRN